MSCLHCLRQGARMRCANCKIALYCNRDCQVADYSQHKGECKAIKKAADAVVKAEQTLRAQFKLDNIDPFSYYFGRFWLLNETRPYMRAKFAHFEVLEEVGTKNALLEAIEIGRDMLNLCTSDNMGVRMRMPPLFLRLNTFNGMQDCYDFIKSKVEENQSIGHANMLEDIQYSIAVTIIKMRLLIQLRGFFNSLDKLFLTTAASESATSPASNLRGNQLVLSTITTYLRPTYPCFADKTVAQLRQLGITLSQQISTLLEAVENNQNNRIWKALVNPKKILLSPIPQYMSFGSAEEAIHVATAFLPLFADRCAEAQAMRQILVDRVGENPDYDLTSMFFRG